MPVEVAVADPGAETKQVGATATEDIPGAEGDQPHPGHHRKAVPLGEVADDLLQVPLGNHSGRSHCPLTARSANDSGNAWDRQRVVRGWPGPLATADPDGPLIA